MADQDKNLSMGDQAQKDIGDAARLGKSAANAVKAAAKAASGNVVGAAVDALKDEKLRQTIVIAVLLPALLFFFLVVCLLHAFPLAIYEVIQGLGTNISTIFESIKEAYLAGRYSDDGNPFTGFFKGIAGVGDLIFGSFFQSSDALAEDSFSEENDLHIFEVSIAPENTTWQKINAAKRKIDARLDLIEEAVINGASGPLNSYFYGQFAARYDTAYDQFLGVTISFTGREASDSDAVKLLALYSVLHDQDPREMKTSDFLRWMGWAGGSNKATLNFKVCGYPCTVSGWSGTFMPRYLVEEARLNPDDDYSSFACAAVDMLLQVSSPSLGSVQATDTLSTIWIEVPRDLDENGEEIIEYDEYGNEIPPQKVPKTIHCVSYTVPITITVRNINALMKAAGLLEGSTAAARMAALEAQIAEDLETEAPVESPAA